MSSRQLSNDSSDDGGDDGKLDSHCTHCSTDNTKGRNHSIGMVDSTRTGNSHIHTKDSNDTHSSDSRTRLLLILARQSAGRALKPIRTPSMQLTETFSS
jgi:hypothetical protein